MNSATPLANASYRLQLNQDYRFSDAQARVQYFSRLGITHVYVSPVLRARATSTHGYDVVDPATINPNLGDKTDLVRFVTALRNYGLALLLDIVPNHMAASIENPYWRDVLTYGRSSPFAGWFDIDWRLPDPEMWGRVLLPVLGESRPKVLEQDQIQINWSDGRFLVRYFDHVLPVDPATVPAICGFGLADLDERLGPDHHVLRQMRDLLRRLEKLPKLVSRLRRRVDIDREETEGWLAQFAQCVVQSPSIEQWAEQTAERFGQGDDGRRRLKKLLDSQPYRLVHWRDAARTINYRRFFDINELVSVRQEDPQVFDDTHATILRWVDDGLVAGLRVDHIDGLRDPLGYLDRLADAVRKRAGDPAAVPIFVEKILAHDEELPAGWPVAGTTGYEFLNQIEAILISPRGFKEIEEQYRRMLRRPIHFADVATWGKRRILRHDLSAQVGRLADTLDRLADGPRHGPSRVVDAPHTSITHFAAGHNDDAGAMSAVLDQVADRQSFNKRDLVDAIAEVMVALPVYRTYVDARHCVVSAADRRVVEAALRGAHRSGRAAPHAIDFLGEVLLLKNRELLASHELLEQVNFIQRFQQLTGPAAAKGIEDTALYAYVPLVSLNEVGGEPRMPASDPVTGLHQANLDRVALRPRGMLAVTTHDTKRTGDVRARLDVLSELPKLWFGLVQRWRRMNRAHSVRVAARRAPDAAAEYLFYQTIVGIWPAREPADHMPMLAADELQQLRERAEAYMLKAAREGKTRTSWTNQNRKYENALLTFVRSLMLPDSSGTFLADVQQLVARIARHGFWNSLARTLIQFTAPGTPDLYQGDELWNFALVDPDNRRPVDEERCQRLLDEVIMGIEAPVEARRQFVRELVESPEDGRIKLHVIRTALAARRDHASLFAKGRYHPLDVGGQGAQHIFAFARSADPGDAPSHHAAIVVVPRLTVGIAATQAPIGDSVWSDTVIRLPKPWNAGGQWTCALTQERIHATDDGNLLVADLLQSFPAALLLR